MSRARADLGWRGERIAASHLEARGYHIVARRWVGAGREIDLIAVRDGVVALVEVKTRRAGALVPGVYAVDARKRRQIEAAARIAARRFDLVGFDFRFDVVSVEVGRGADEVIVEHIEDAFRA